MGGSDTIEHVGGVRVSEPVWGDIFLGRAALRTRRISYDRERRAFVVDSNLTTEEPVWLRLVRDSWFQVSVRGCFALKAFHAGPVGQHLSV